MMGKIIVCYIFVVFTGYISGKLYLDRFSGESPNDLNEEVLLDEASPAWQEPPRHATASANNITEEYFETSVEWEMETASVADLLEYSKLFSFAEREYFFRELAENRPIDFIEALDGSFIPNRNYFLGIALSKVPDARYIVDFLSRGEPGNLRFQIWVAEIFSGWVEQSPNEARAFLVEHGSAFGAGPLQYKAMMRSVMRHEGTDGAYLYLAELYNDRRAFNGALHENLEPIVKKDPIFAAKWFLEHFDSAASKSGLIMSMRRYGEIDPESAAIFAENLPKGRERHVSMALIAKEWSKTDPIGVVKWFDGLEHGITRDVVIGTFAEELAADFPVEVMGVVSRIENPRYRKTLIPKIVKNAFEGNPTEFETALENYDGPDEILNEFREAME